MRGTVGAVPRVPPPAPGLPSVGLGISWKIKLGLVGTHSKCLNAISAVSNRIPLPILSGQGEQLQPLTGISLVKDLMLSNS